MNSPDCTTGRLSLAVLPSRELIDAVVFCPLCGANDSVREGRGRFYRCCGHRDFNNPIVAVAAYVFDATGRVLLIRRGQEPGLGMLAPPGGFVDAGESLEVGLLRELKEEVGVEVDELSYVGSWPNNYAYRGLVRPVCDVYFRARLVAGPMGLDAGEVQSATWWPSAAVVAEDLAFPAMRLAWRALTNLTAPRPD